MEAGTLGPVTAPAKRDNRAGLWYFVAAGAGLCFSGPAAGARPRSPRTLGRCAPGTNRACESY